MALVINIYFRPFIGAPFVFQVADVNVGGRGCRLPWPSSGCCTFAEESRNGLGSPSFSWASNLMAPRTCFPPELWSVWCRILSQLRWLLGLCLEELLFFLEIVHKHIEVHTQVLWVELRRRFAMVELPTSKVGRHGLGDHWEAKSQANCAVTFPYSTHWK